MIKLDENEPLMAFKILYLSHLKNIFLNYFIFIFSTIQLYFIILIVG